MFANETTFAIMATYLWPLTVYRGFYMSAQILLNLLNNLGKRDKMRVLLSILSLFATCLINSIMKEHEC